MLAKDGYEDEDCIEHELDYDDEEDYEEDFQFSSGSFRICGVCKDYETAKKYMAYLKAGSETWIEEFQLL